MYKRQVSAWLNEPAVVPAVLFVIPVPALYTVSTSELLVPAPIKVLTSAAEIPEFKVGSDPSLNIAGVPAPSTLLVPAPIKLLTSAAVTPDANVGVPPPLNIPGSAYRVGLLDNDA